MKLLTSFAALIFPLFFLGCTASYNGVGIDTTEDAYFAPYYPSNSDEVAVVYIYWNQPEVEQYFPTIKKPRWSTRVNGKTNAKLEMGSYSVVEVNPGRVRVDARKQLGGPENISNRDPSLSLTAEAGKTYFVKAQLEQGSVGLELRFYQIHDEREAYNFLYGTKYQKNQQESMLY